MHILIVDDDLDDIFLLTEDLLQYGYEVWTANNGERALTQVQAQPVDIVSLDVNLPRLNGIELIPRLQALLPEVTIILLTNYGTISQAVEAMRLGAFDYLQKPVQLQQLRAVIERAWKAKEPQVVLFQSFAPTTDSYKKTPVPTPAFSENLALSDWNQAKQSGPQDMSVWGIGFDESKGRISPAGFHTFRIEPHMVITAPYHFLNRTTEVQPRRFFMLLNEVQVKGGMGIDAEADYVDVTIQPGQEITVPVNIPPLESGAHDLLIISILNPDEPSGLDFSRQTLLAGETISQSQRPYTILKDAHTPVNPALFITDDMQDPPGELHEWPVAHYSPQQLVNYAIYVGYNSISDPAAPDNSGNTPYRFALLAFLDHRQVSLQKDREMVLYGEVSENTTGRTLGSVQLPVEKGKHSLLLVLIENPGIILGDTVKSPDESGPATLLPWFIDAKDVIIFTE